MKVIDNQLLTDLVKKIIYYTQSDALGSPIVFAEGLSEENIDRFAAAISEDIFNSNKSGFSSVEEVRNQVDRIISNFMSSDQSE